MDHPTRAPLSAAAPHARRRALLRHGRRAVCVALLLALPVTGTLARAADDDLAAQVNTFIGTRAMRATPSPAPPRRSA
ncbi:hypothetical protein QE386_003643 [Pseudoxanthomonas winnipegensis]|nr:hypothetical protein [Pseudoxanthomonas winnipegensis]